MDKGDFIQVLLLIIAFLIVAGLIYLFVVGLIVLACIATLAAIGGTYILSRFIK